MMKKYFILLNFLLCVIVVVKISLTTPSCMFYYDTQQATNCHKEIPLNCHSQSSKKENSRSCSNNQNCCISCCTLNYYLSINQHNNNFSLKEVIIKEVIDINPNFYKNNYKKEFFHPPKLI